jgi:dehydratase
MKLRPRIPGRLATAAALAVGSALLVAAPAAADPQTILYACRTTSVFGPVDTTLDAEVEAVAPATVAGGGDLTITVVTSPDTVPATASGLPLTSVSDFRLVFPVPANSTLVSASLSGGEGFGDAEPVLTVEGDDVVVTLDATLAGGASYTLPVLTLNLTAGAAGTIDFALGGTSYEDPGLSLTSTVDVFGTPLSSPTACYPNPNPVLSSTTITTA